MSRRTLEIDEDLAFQQKEWLWQRVGIVVLFLFVLAALLGLTGTGGPLNHGEAGDRDGALHVEFERFVRRGAMATVTIHVRSSAPGDVRFWISTPYIEEIRLDTMAPPADAVQADRTRHIYTLRPEMRELTVTLDVEHKTLGRIQGEVGMIGGPSVRFSQVSLF